MIRYSGFIEFTVPDHGVLHQKKKHLSPRTIGIQVMNFNSGCVETTVKVGNYHISYLEADIKK